MYETEYGREDQLIASIKGAPFLKSWQMNAGESWDQVLSRPLGVPRAFEQSGHYCFDIEAVRQAKLILGPGVWQVKATKVFNIGGVPVCLVAKADHACGLFLSEVKAKFSQVDVTDYDPSLQHRCYLLCHEAAAVRYVLFSFKDPVESTDFEGRPKNYCQLRDITSFRYWTYAGLHDEVAEWLHSFLGWAERWNLLKHLEREGSTPEVA